MAIKELIMKKENFLSYVFIGIFIGAGLFYFSEYNTKRIVKKYCNKLYEMKVSGVIDTAYYGSKGTYTLVVNDNVLKEQFKIFNTYLNNPYRDRYFNKGDSLFKPANSFKYYIYKQCNPDSLVFLERNITCDDYVNNIYGD